MTEAVSCPGCGALQTQTGWGEELCPSCLLRLALLSPVSEDSAESPTWAMGDEARTPAAEPGEGSKEPGVGIGQVLGQRYQVRSFLGKGGMGEVWRAYDLKLRVEVALKALKKDLGTDATRLELLRAEVRAAREVTSPNVCRIYDLVELDGTELVSMEYVDGTTLLDVMRQQSPMDPPEAQEMVSQFLAGLEAIHGAGLVHRDVKPENIMVTRTGRVVLMDMGIARSPEEGAGSVAGTPAYMAPEQARGEADARSDLFSAGVILAEMVSPEGVRDFESRQSVWTGIRSEPVRVPDSPWSPVVRKAVAKDPEERFQTAHELTRALEDVAFRVHDETGLEPYPGLASFDERDAEYFFGREAEIEAVWKKLQSAQLLGIIGASGSGKSSFIGAGLLPSKPDGWSIVRCTPGSAVVDSLRRAIVPEIESDPGAVQQLAAGGDEALVDAFGAWRRQHAEVLLIVDQFEELFTQNTEEMEARTAELLGRIALDADVHVLLSMRDDFLMRCNRLDELRPVFSELTALDPPRGSALRRAVVQPALRCGYRFEDEALADEILAEVEGERGALPLLAFALARLWEKRDRENGLITRQAYQDIGGVGGALARHAETTVDRIGHERIPIVRELFRNLVTAEGTRAVREWNEVLSVFSGKSGLRSPGDKPPGYGEGEGRRSPGDKPPGYDRSSPDVGGGLTPPQSEAEEVLRALIDARLLTSYEVQEEDAKPTRRVEIIHESLLGNWPRLVRWQTQDQEGAQLRDELRQAAKRWDEQGRTDDRVWTGASFKEYEVWRDRYPGGLTELEQAFGEAMSSLANRRRRRRRIAIAVILAVAVGVGATTTTLWRRSVAETRRAEAGKLLALGQAQLEDDPTAALAYARASLGLADTPEARRFAVEVLWRGPVARLLPLKQMAQEAGLAYEPSAFSAFEISPDGRWLARSSGDHQVYLFPRDGGPPLALQNPPDGNVSVLAFGPRSEVLVTGGSGSSMSFWSLPELEEIRTVNLGGVRSRGYFQDGELLTFTHMDDTSREVIRRDWPLPDGEPEILENTVFPRGSFDMANLPDGTRVVAHGRGRQVVVTPLEPSGYVREQILGEAGDVIRDVAVAPGGDRVASLDRSGQIRVWSTSGREAPLHVFYGPQVEVFRTLFDPTGRYLTQMGPNGWFLLWDLESPPGTEPRVLQRRAYSGRSDCDFDPRGRWAFTVIGEGEIELWPLDAPWVRIFEDVSSTIWSMAFTGDRQWLATCPLSQTARLWPLHAEWGNSTELAETDPCAILGVHPERDGIVVGTQWGEVLMYPTSGEPPQKLPGGFGGAWTGALGFDPRSPRVVAGPGTGRGFDDPAQRILRIWDLESGNEEVVSVANITRPGWVGAYGLGFAHDGTLYASLGENDRTMHLTLPGESGGELSAETVVAAGTSIPSLSRDGNFLMVHSSANAGFSFEFENLLLFDLVNDTSRRIASHGTRLTAKTQLDPTGRIIVTGDIDGVVRAGPATGEEPHLLLGHRGMIVSLAISPDGRWIASADDVSVRLWPMPDVTKPPLHTLPHDELLAKLDTFTNLRAVRDESSSTGWTLDVGPFPGWETVPSW